MLIWQAQFHGPNMPEFSTFHSIFIDHGSQIAIGLPGRLVYILGMETGKILDINNATCLTANSDINTLTVRAPPVMPKDHYN